MQDVLDPNRIEEILNYTIDVLHESKIQMFDIVATAQAEYENISLAIEELKYDINLTIQTVDRLDHDFRQTRIRLAELSHNFNKVSDQERTKVYKKADQIRESLAVTRERERILLNRRQEQEQALIRIASLVAKGEKMVSQVGIALDFLGGNLEVINEQLEGIQLRDQLGKKIIKMQEDERKRVAREIHDGPAQNLANVALKAEICERLYQSGRTFEFLTELGELKLAVKDSLQEVREIIHNLRPMVLDDLGLIPAVKRLTEDMKHKNDMVISLSVIGSEVRLDSSIEVAVYRIIQESLNNCRKYANATEVIIRIEFLQNQINAVIVDNGIGFELSTLNKKLTDGDHFGLYGMEERVELLNGNFNIHSNKGEGTRVRIKIPFGQVEECE